MYLLNSLFRVQSNEKNCNLPKFFAEKYQNKCIFYPFCTKCRGKRPIYRQKKRGYHTILVVGNLRKSYIFVIR